MKLSSIVIILAILVVSASDPADARARRHAQLRCADYPAHFPAYGFLFNPAPPPNGCAPPVYQYGEYVGQDPDPFIRLQLKRDPATGYTGQFAR